jgi:hypothetical protein
MVCIRPCPLPVCLTCLVKKMAAVGMQGAINLFSKTGEGRDVGSGSHGRVRDEAERGMEFLC